MVAEMNANSLMAITITLFACLILFGCSSGGPSKRTSAGIQVQNDEQIREAIKEFDKANR